ncbi:hypothetical protein [Rhodoplanes azumiensis]|uniref:Uncharacterized protein n=1 Tax=Rhodoplanes azumiensis TaxID=1897628 RepID=A0ABW5APU5_9BRAD
MTADHHARLAALRQKYMDARLRGDAAEVARLDTELAAAEAALGIVDGTAAAAPSSIWGPIVEEANTRRCGARRPEPEPAEPSSAATASTADIWSEARDRAAARRGL